MRPGACTASTECASGICRDGMWIAGGDLGVDVDGGSDDDFGRSKAVF